MVDSVGELRFIEGENRYLLSSEFYSTESKFTHYFLQDDAPPHTVRRVWDFLADFGISVFHWQACIWTWWKAFGQWSGDVPFEWISDPIPIVCGRPWIRFGEAWVLKKSDILWISCLQTSRAVIVAKGASPNSEVLFNCF